MSKSYLEAANSRSERDKPQVLYLVHRFPYPPDKGDRIRAFNIIRYLSQHCELSVATLADEPVRDEHVGQLRRFCRRLAVVPLRRVGRWSSALYWLAAGRTITEGAFASRGLRRIVRTWCSESSFQAVLASASSMVSYLRLRELTSTRKVVDLVDVDSEKWLQYAADSRWPRRWLYRAEGERLRRLERSLLGFADAITLVSQAEADLYRRVCGSGRVHAVRNGVDLDYFAPPADPPPREPSCVFVGAMDYRPNVEGMLWFARHVWPQVRRRHPQATLYVVGHRPTPAILRLADEPGIVVTGSVPDVRPYLARAAAVVAPLQIARGIQNKVLEAMAVGRLVVASPGAITGLKVRPGEELIQATSAEEWVRALTEALSDYDLQNQFGWRARSYVQRYHDWSAALAPLNDLLAIGRDHRADGHQGVAGCVAELARVQGSLVLGPKSGDFGYDEPLGLEAPAT